MRLPFPYKPRSKCLKCLALSIDAGLQAISNPSYTSAQDGSKSTPKPLPDKGARHIRRINSGFREAGQ